MSPTLLASWTQTATQSLIKVLPEAAAPQQERPTCTLPLRERGASERPELDLALLEGKLLGGRGVVTTYVYIHIYIYIYMFACTYSYGMKYLYICIYMITDPCRYTYIYRIISTHTCLCIYTSTYICTMRTHVYICTHTYRDTCAHAHVLHSVCVHVYIQMYIYMHICLYIYIYMYMGLQAGLLWFCMLSTAVDIRLLEGSIRTLSHSP